MQPCSTNWLLQLPLRLLLQVCLVLRFETLFLVFQLGIDAPQVKKKYYPVAAKLIQQVAGGTRVHVYEHTLRAGSVRYESGALIHILH